MSPTDRASSPVMALDICLLTQLLIFPWERPSTKTGHSLSTYLMQAINAIWWTIVTASAVPTTMIPGSSGSRSDTASSTDLWLGLLTAWGTDHDIRAAADSSAIGNDGSH